MKRTMVFVLALCLTFSVPITALAQSASFSAMANLMEQTVRITTTNSSVALTAAIDAALLKALDYTKVKAVLITCETYDARVSFGTAAVQSDTVPVGHVLSVGSSLRVPSNSMLRGAYIISKTANQHAVLQITLEQ